MPAPISAPNAGVKTTEFWLVLAAAVVNLVGEIAGYVPQPWGTVASTAIAAVYAILRTVLKRAPVS